MNFKLILSLFLFTSTMLLAQEIGVEVQSEQKAVSSLTRSISTDSEEGEKQLSTSSILLQMQYDHLQTVSDYLREDASGNKSDAVPNDRKILGIDNELFYFLSAAALSLGAYLIWSEDEPKAEKKLTFGLPPVPIK